MSEFRAKRELGEGRWDKVLKRRMVELSNADNYDDAKEEWIATGSVWWGGLNAVPDWVENSEKGQGKCLCGHTVVYHFEILNTENGNIECVGSDHINTYLIIRAIAEELKIPADTITDKDIQEWIDVRVTSLKSTAWWAENGENFTKMFDKVKEIDLHFNVHNTNKWYWDSEIGDNRRVTKIRKVGKGEFGRDNYRMASVVWRWNHPDNPRNQQSKAGYPNDLLMRDLSYLYITSKDKIAKYNAYKDEIAEKKAARIAYLEQQAILREERARRSAEAAAERARLWEEGRPAREEAERVRQEKRDERRRIEAIRTEQRQAQREIENIRFLESTSDIFEQMCSYYGIPVFDASLSTSRWETTFLKDIKLRLSSKEELTNSQLTSLRGIVGKPATDKQIQYLKDLGIADADDRSLTRKQASKLIEKMRNNS
jgi:hypothetical protein